MSVGVPGRAVEAKLTVNRGFYACVTHVGEGSDKNVQATKTLLSDKTLQHRVQDRVDCQFRGVLLDIAIA